MAQPYSYMAEPNKPAAQPTQQPSWGQNQQSYGQQGNSPEPLQPFNYQATPRSTANYGFPNTQAGMQTTQPTQQPYQNFLNDPKLYDVATYNDKNSPYSRALENTLPAMQFGQNQYQYQNDYDEAQRRWLAQFEWTRQGDQFNQTLASQQQTAAQWQAQTAANQWGQQFGQNQVNDTRNYGLAQGRLGLDQTIAGQNYNLGQGQLRNAATDSLRDYRLGNRGLDVQATQGTRDYRLGQRAADTSQFSASTQRSQGNRNLDIQALQGTRDYNLGNRGLDIQALQGTRDYKLGSRAADTNQFSAQTGRQQVKNDLALGTRAADTNQFGAQTQRDVGMGQLGVAQQANTIDQMWKSGQLSNQQRELALNELTQSQRNTLDTRTQDSLEQYRNSQMAQELQMMREQLAAQAEQARWGQFGRNQTPNARWTRGGMGWG